MKQRVRHTAPRKRRSRPASWQRAQARAELVEEGIRKFDALTKPARDFSADWEFELLSRGIKRLRKKTPPKAGTNKAGRVVEAFVQEDENGFLVKLPRVMSGDTRRRRRGRRAG